MPTAETRASHTSVADRYRVLLDIGRTLTGTLSREELFRAIYRETRRVLETSGFFISLYDAEHDLATIVFYADQGVEQRVEVSYQGSDSEVLRNGRGALVEDRAEVRSVMVVGEKEGEVTRSAISAPLVHKGRVVGAISAQSYEPRAYRKEDLELLQGIADVAAVALENARYVATLERQRREAEQIEEIGRALASSLDRQEVLQKVIDAVLHLLQADAAAVWLIAGGTVARMAMSAGRITLAEGSEWDLRGALERRLLIERRPFAIPDLGASPAVPAGLRSQITNGSGIAVPLVAGADVLGMLTARSAQTGFFTEDETRILLRLSNQASVALENARLHASVQALSLTDPLTGLPNRRQINLHLEREVGAARRGRNLVVCVHDLDYFKEYNDSAGHLAGDEALRAFARALKVDNRSTNLVARFGGDEFVSVLTESTIEGAQLYVQRLNERIDMDPILGPSKIKMSTGLAAFDRETMKDANDVIQAADAELYRMKSARKR